MIAGALDVMLLQMDSVAAMVKAKVPVQVLTATQQGGIVTIVANKKDQATHGSGLQALKNFDGATWGIPSVGGAGELFIKLAAQAAGLDWSKQKVVVVGNTGAGPALQSGRVDIAASSPIAMYAAMGTDGYTVFNTSSQEGSDKVWGKVLGGLMIANKAFVQKYPQLSVALTAPTIASLQKFQSFTDPHVAFQSFTPDYRAQVPSESAYVLGFPDSQQVSLGIDGLLRQSEVDNTIKVLQQAGTVPADATFDADIFNNDFAAEAFKRLGEPVPKP